MINPDSFSSCAVRLPLEIHTSAPSEERERSEGPFQGKEGRVATGRAISRNPFMFGLAQKTRNGQSILLPRLHCFVVHLPITLQESAHVTSIIIVYRRCKSILQLSFIGNFSSPLFNMHVYYANLYSIHMDKDWYSLSIFRLYHVTI